LSFWKRMKGAASSSGAWKNKVAGFLPLLAGILLTGLAILAARQRITAIERDIVGKAAPTKIVVASRAIPAGTAFSMENLSGKSVPFAGTSRRNVPAPDFELLLGARTKVEISEGEPVLWTDVEEPFDADSFSQTIKKGQRAITLEADRRASFSGLLRPGDHVDLLREGTDGRGCIPLLFDVPVLAVDRSFLPLSPAGEETDVDTITVSVSSDEAARLTAAEKEGRISWLLRNPSDRGNPAKNQRMLARKSPPVEIWKAGIREISLPQASRIGEPE
jgi:pilus assembly protein CpaB